MPNCDPWQQRGGIASPERDYKAEFRISSAERRDDDDDDTDPDPQPPAE